MYAGDLSVIADGEENVVWKLNFWKEGLERKGCG